MKTLIVVLVAGLFAVSASSEPAATDKTATHESQQTTDTTATEKNSANETKGKTVHHHRNADKKETASAPGGTQSKAATTGTRSSTAGSTIPSKAREELRRERIARARLARILRDRLIWEARMRELHFLWAEETDPAEWLGTWTSGANTLTLQQGGIAASNSATASTSPSGWVSSGNYALLTSASGVSEHLVMGADKRTFIEFGPNQATAVWQRE